MWGVHSMWWGMVGIGFWRGRGAGVFRSDLRVCARTRASGCWLLVGRVVGGVFGRALAGCFLVVVGWLVGVAF